jgi:CMP-N,N'-diacetyllegionaminic acid synthase
MKNILCTIGARAGSKGLRGKNLKSLCGQPLISHSIQQAKKCNLITKIAVTSDSDEILKISNEYGADFLIKRPDELATDTAPKIPAIKHCVLEVENILSNKFDFIIDLDPTSPLRSIQDITNCLELMINTSAPNLITAMPSRRSPYFNLVEKNFDGQWRPSKTLGELVTRRQSAPKTYDMNASIYIYKRDILISNLTLWNEGTLLYEMPEERSFDIDTPLDFEIVEFLMKRANF